MFILKTQTIIIRIIIALSVFTPTSRTQTFGEIRFLFSTIHLPTLQSQYHIFKESSKYKLTSLIGLISPDPDNPKFGQLVMVGSL